VLGRSEVWVGVCGVTDPPKSEKSVENSAPHTNTHTQHANNTYTHHFDAKKYGTLYCMIAEIIKLNVKYDLGPERAHKNRDSSPKNGPKNNIIEKWTLSRTQYCKSRVGAVPRTIRKLLRELKQRAFYTEN